MKSKKEFTVLAKAMSEMDFCMMQTVSKTGVNTRPMSNNGAVEYDGDNWFFSRRDTQKVREISKDERVQLIFADSKAVSFISVWGKGDVTDDGKLKKKHWHKELEQWFENGPEDPEVVLIKVTAHRIQSWGKVGDFDISL